MTNEEKIIAMLEAQGRTLEAQGREIAKINIAIEHDICPKIDLLFEGQRTLLETLAPKNRVEALEDEVSFLKQMIKTLASEMDNLKKAQ